MQKLLEALTVASEVCGAPMSEISARFIVRELQQYPEPDVLKALNRCARECKRSLTMADIIERIPDGRPSPNEAWARMPKDEYSAGVVTDEMLSAWGIAGSLYDSDQVAARMAFLSTYQSKCQDAKDRKEPVKWRLTAGFDRMATESAARKGIEDGLITLEQAKPMLSFDRIAALEAESGPRLLSNDHTANRERLNKMLAGVEAQLSLPDPAASGKQGEMP